MLSPCTGGDHGYAKAIRKPAPTRRTDPGIAAPGWQRGAAAWSLVGWLILSGLSGPGIPRADAQASEPEGTWEVVGQMPEPRNESAAAVVGGRIYIYVGYGGDPNPSRVRSC